MHKNIREIFCFIDDFAKLYEQSERKHLSPSNRQRYLEPNTSLGELLTIMVIFYTSYAKNFKYFKYFKYFYKSYIEYFYIKDFPKAVSYNRFIELIPRLFIPLNILLHLLFDEETGRYFIDSTTIKACHNKRRYRNKVLAGLAKSGRSSMGYFYGFKLHVIINHKGEFMDLKMTKGNVVYRAPVPELSRGLTGVIGADKGYIRQIYLSNYMSQGFEMIYSIKKNMKNKLMDLSEKILLRKRSIIESVFDYLKNKVEIEHTRHRLFINAFVHIISIIVAYSLKKHKPSINFSYSVSAPVPLIPN